MIHMLHVDEWVVILVLVTYRWYSAVCYICIGAGAGTSVVKMACSGVYYICEGGVVVVQVM